MSDAMSVHRPSGNLMADAIVPLSTWGYELAVQIAGIFVDA
jgi:hypothetical protein